jgi:ubiquitin-conjugating enzyme E2 M
MLKNFKQKRETTEKELESKSNTNLKTVEQRMKIDIQKYGENAIDNVTITFPNEGVTDLHIRIVPNQERSFYRHSAINFSFKATEEYPFKPPEIKCLNKILHPNIDKNGNVCLSILRSGWKPIYELYQVCMGLLHLLENIKAADLEEPLDHDAAALMNKDIAEFDKVVQETIRGKSYFGRQFDNVYIAPKK